MALILNKTTIEPTSWDESGNTLTTGYTHLNYVDDFGGINDNPYLIISSVNIDKINRHAVILIFIYKDVQSRTDNKNPLHGQELYVSEDTFDTYFSMNNLESTNVFKKAYEYISTVYTGWKSDE